MDEAPGRFGSLESQGGQSGPQAGRTGTGSAPPPRPGSGRGLAAAPAPDSALRDPGGR